MQKQLLIPLTFAIALSLLVVGCSTPPSPQASPSPAADGTTAPQLAPINKAKKAGKAAEEAQQQRQQTPNP